jgi:predicted transposase/invertase (TIGR01784 family)
MRAEKAVNKVSFRQKWYAYKLSRMKYILDKQSDELCAKEAAERRMLEAREQGLAEGRTEGKAEKARETARKMKAAGESLEKIAEFTDLLPEEIEKL